ncbi:hypothetical protein VP03_15445 [Sinorhizobium meliloti]|nr:hypothetical protein VP03_15445 [Sinorhizobium meliloti]
MYLPVLRFFSLSAALLASVNGTVANLKWTRAGYADELRRRFGEDVDYRRRPSEDFARATVTLEDEEGNELMIEATTSPMATSAKNSSATFCTPALTDTGQ